MTQTNNASTGTAELTFHGCREEITLAACNSPGQPSGTITTNSVVTHDIIISPAPNKKVGTLLTGVNVTFTCLGICSKTVTGNVIGEIVNSGCGVAKTTTEVKYEAGAATGSQKYTQITTTGTVFDLTSNTDAGGAYETSSQTGSGKITWNAGSTRHA